MAEIHRNLWDRAANTWRRLVDTATVTWDTSTPGVARANAAFTIPPGSIGTTELADGAATNAKLADMAAWTLKMRNAGTTGDPQDVTINGLTEETSIDGATDFLPLWDASGAVMRKGKPANLVQAGGLQLLNSGVVSNAATLDIVLTSFTAYRGLQFVLTGVQPITDAVDLWMRFSTDGGSNYLATGYNSRVLILFDDGFFESYGGSAQAQILMNCSDATGRQSNAAGHGANYIVDLLNQASASFFPRANIQGSYFSDGDFGVYVSGQGMHETAQDCNAVRFLMSSGNITAAWALYGYA